MSAEERFQRQRVSAVPLLLFAAIDLVVALVILLGNGFSGAFFAIFAIGSALAGVGFYRLLRKPPE